MAAKKKTTKKGRAKSDAGLIDELEKAGTRLIGEIGQLFDDLTARVADTSRTVASTTTLAADRVIGSESALREQVEGLLTDVEKGGKELARVSGELFENLKSRVSLAEKPKRVKAKKKVKKKAAKKKSASKKAVAKKKKSSKKSGSKKKS